MGCKHNWQITHSNDAYPFRCTKCGKRSTGVKKHSGQSNSKRIIIVSLVITCVLIGGYFVFQIYGTSQTIQNEANNMIEKTGNTIQQISSQVSNQTITSLHSISVPNNPISLPNNSAHVPITVYDNCQSTVRTDLKSIDTFCNLPNFAQKQFKFPLPAALEQGLQPGEAMLGVKTKVYQYGPNDFTIGLYDQVGEKNYTVSLWELPQ